jgi:hypothetical protein
LNRASEGAIFSGGFDSAGINPNVALFVFFLKKASALPT